MRVGRNVMLLGLMTSALIGCRSRDDRMAKLQAALDSNVVLPKKLDGAMVLGETNLTGNRNIEGGLPSLPSSFHESTDDFYLSRKQFVILYNAKAKVPVWTSWQLVKSDLGEQTRTNSFRGDPILNTYMEVKEGKKGVGADDYGNTCFDRGHQAPSADRSKNKEDNEATYFMSNMAPQTSFLNKRIWADLEVDTRELVETKGHKLQIYAGPIMRDGREGVGPDKDIQVPEAFYKVIAIYKDKEAEKPSDYIAVIMGNVTSDGLDPLANREENCKEHEHGGTGRLSTSWKDYKVKLKEITRRAGVSFPILADLQEK